MSWRVSEVVAALPALLELAVVLFVTGIPLFLWTMDITVAIITTVFVGFLLIIITTITILPAINRTFPYKSPVAWGFWKLMIVTTSFVRTRRKLSSSTILPVIVPSEESSTAPHDGKQDRMSTTWQKRDLDHSKMEEQQHLWMLLRWFCSEWSDHRLAPVHEGPCLRRECAEYSIPQLCRSHSDECACASESLIFQDVAPVDQYLRSSIRTAPCSLSTGFDSEHVRCSCFEGADQVATMENACDDKRRDDSVPPSCNNGRSHTRYL
jgi:hypothetical protein